MIRIMAVNWNFWLNQWVLFRRIGGSWTFGQVQSFIPGTDTLNMLALAGQQFQTVSVPANNNVSEAWGIAGWSQYTLQPGAAAQNAVGRWLLIRNDINQWSFGKVASYDAPNNSIRLLSLVNNVFRYENKFLSPIVETWMVDRWSSIPTGAGSRGGFSAEPMP